MEFYYVGDLTPKQALAWNLLKEIKLSTLLTVGALLNGH